MGPSGLAAGRAGARLFLLTLSSGLKGLAQVGGGWAVRREGWPRTQGGANPVASPQRKAQRPREPERNERETEEKEPVPVHALAGDQSPQRGHLVLGFFKKIYFSVTVDL